MKKLLLIAGVLGALYLSQDRLPRLADEAGFPDGEAALVQAFEARRSNVQIQGSGTVARILPDDTDGSRHQRFVLAFGTGQTVLIAHNIDLAPRIAGLGVGDIVEFNGEYEWNARGGVVHWTHQDPQGRHTPGWLRHDGRTYQ